MSTKKKAQKQDAKNAAAIAAATGTEAIQKEKKAEEDEIDR